MDEGLDRARAKLFPLVLCLLVLFSLDVDAATYAFLIGVGDYPQLPANLRLKGPSNDVQAMRETLEKKGIPAKRIHTLVDREATRANIIGAFQRLAGEVGRDDLVVLYFSGHGSQAPVDIKGGRSNEEPDQLNELFLPADVGAWDGRRGKVSNALSDDDLNEQVTALRRRGAFVWAIFDTCHAATSTRGGDGGGMSGGEEFDSVARSVPPEMLGIPKMVLRNTHRGGFSRDVLLKPGDPGPGTAGLVAYYAADANDLAREQPFQDGIAGRRHYGVFTHALVQALQSNTRLPTYQALLDQTALLVSAIPGQPTPSLEGAAFLNQAVLTAPPLPPPPLQFVPELRMAAQPGSGAVAQRLLDSLIRRHNSSEAGFNLKTAPAREADAVIRTCPDGRHYLAPAGADICGDPASRAFPLVERRGQHGLTHQDLCRMAAGVHLRRLADRQKANAKQTANQVSFEVRRRGEEKDSPISSGQRLQLKDGDVIRPRILFPAGHSVAYSLFFIDAKGRAWPFADSRTSPPVHAGKGTTELTLEGLRIQTGAEATLGLERSVLILHESEGGNANQHWVALTSCAENTSPLMYPGDGSGAVELAWETVR